MHTHTQMTTCIFIYTYTYNGGGEFFTRTDHHPFLLLSVASSWEHRVFNFFLFSPLLRWCERLFLIQWWKFLFF